MAEPNYYAILELSNPFTCTANDIKRAYRRLALRHHPDKNGNTQASTEKFRALQDAYETLGDAEKRRRYDAAPALPEYNWWDGFETEDGIDREYGTSPLDPFERFCSTPSPPPPPGPLQYVWHKTSRYYNERKTRLPSDMEKPKRYARNTVSPEPPPTAAEPSFPQPGDKPRLLIEPAPTTKTCTHPKDWLPYEGPICSCSKCQEWNSQLFACVDCGEVTCLFCLSAMEDGEVGGVEECDTYFG